MIYREAKEQDTKGIIRVFTEALNVKSDEIAAEAFAYERAAGHLYIVADDNSTIAGFVSGVREGRPDHGLAELVHIATLPLPEYRRRGMAQDLYWELVESFKVRYQEWGYDLRKLVLKTHSDNEDAQRFYKKQGMVEEARLPNYFRQGVDEMVMSMYFD